MKSSKIVYSRCSLNLLFVHETNLSTNVFFFFSARLLAVYVESDRMEKHRPLYDEQHFQIGAW